MYITITVLNFITHYEFRAKWNNRDFINVIRLILPIDLRTCIKELPDENKVDIIINYVNRSTYEKI